MKKLFIILIILLLGITLSYWIQKDAGYILISYHHTSLETSLWAGLLLLLLTYFILHLVFRLIISGVALPKQFRHWQHKRMTTKNQDAFDQALMQLCTSDFQSAYNQFERLSRKQPTVKAHLGAAFTAYRQGDLNKMNKHFNQANNLTDNSFAILFCHAEALYQLQEYDTALVQLDSAEQIIPQQPQYYSLAIKIQQAKQNGPALLKLLPLARRYSNLSKAELLTIEAEALQFALTDTAAVSSEEELDALWPACSKGNKKDAKIIYLYYLRLSQFNPERACAEMVKAITKSGFYHLTPLFLDASSENNIDKLAKIEAWLQKHPHEPVLFSCAAKLYQNEGMFKKAISALDTANGIQPSAELTAQLAQAYLKQGNDSQAIAYYQQALNDYQTT